MQSQSIGLALTLTLLTGTLVALDLTDARTGSTQRINSPRLSMSDGLRAGRNEDVGTLAIMPSSVPGITIPKADISDGVFAVGSSTGKEGLDEEREGSNQEDDAEDASDSPPSNADKANDFVLI